LNIPANECSAPAIPHGTVSNAKNVYVYQETVTITCNAGYTIQGQGQIQCQADTTWSDPPICKSK